jgi:hypothetical protein
MSKNEENEGKWKDILNLVQSHLVDSIPCLHSELSAAQSFKSPKIYTTFHHPLLTALPPVTPIQQHPTESLFCILQSGEKVSTKLFAGVFDWVNENILHEDPELGGRVKEKWVTIIAAIVHPDSTIAYYKVHDGIHKPLEGTAGV